MKKSTEMESNEEETALFAGCFKGIWHNRGEMGHKKLNCPKDKKNKKGKGRGNFGNILNHKGAHCGKYRHNDEKCWVKFGKPDHANMGLENAQDMMLVAVENTQVFVKNEQTKAGKLNTKENQKKFKEVSHHFGFGAQEN